MTRTGVLTLVLTLFAGGTAWAQNRAEITAYGGWQFGGVTYGPTTPAPVGHRDPARSSSSSIIPTITGYG